MNELGVLKFFKKDEVGEIIDTQETYNKEYIDDAMQKLLQVVDDKIATITQND